MEKTRGRLPIAPEVPEAREEISGLPWKITLAFLVLLFIILTWYPISRINAQYAFFSNEGFNTSFAAMVASGAKMYANPPVWWHANYPPVSYHLISWLSAITHDLNVTGRWLALFSYLSIGALIALIVERLSHSWKYATYAAFCW